MLIFAVSVKKVQIHPLPVISRVTVPVLIIFVRDVAKILPLNICQSDLRYSNPFWNSSVLDDGQFAKFNQNWLPWQRPLRNRKKEIRIHKMQTNTFYMVKKIMKIGSVDPGIIWLKLQKEKLTHAKHMTFPTSFPSGLNSTVIRESLNHHK